MSSIKRICKDCGKKLGLFSKKIKYYDIRIKKGYFVCKDCYENNRKDKEKEIAKNLSVDFLKAKRYAQTNNVDLVTAYKKLKLGDFKND